MDITNAILAKSDQLNSTDLSGGPQTVTIVDVVKGSDDQPVNIITDTFGKIRPFKPSKTVLRILAGVWGKETAAWVGRRMTIFRDPSVRWAGEEIGGIRIKELSHIDKPIVFNLPTSKGKHAKSTVTPLVEPAPPAPALDPATLAEWIETLTNADTLPALQAAWQSAGKQVTTHPDAVAAKDQRKAELQAVGE